ncbi:MAG: DegV family protein [Lachnospiraceae bacterium]|nr:DegV family protein [Lachnospiraceae bacterium]
MIRVYSDSTCDLSPELLERYHIGIIPLHVHLGERTCRDGVDVTPDEIFSWSDANNATPKTSAPSLEEVMEIYRGVLDAGDELVVFTISSSMSSSNNVCMLAAQELEAEDRVTVIDSENLSTGVGLLVVEAAELAAQGVSRPEIQKKIEEYRPRVRASFVVDTLVYLHRGGRCSGLAALMGSALKLHPRIVVQNGAMHSDRKYRGSIDKVVMSYSKELEEALKTAKPDRVFITHTMLSNEPVLAVKEYLESLRHFNEVLDTHAGGVISSHCGPGTLGVLFIAGE